MVHLSQFSTGNRHIQCAHLLIAANLVERALLKTIEGTYSHLQHILEGIYKQLRRLLGAQAGCHFHFDSVQFAIEMFSSCCASTSICMQSVKTRPEIKKQRKGNRKHPDQSNMSNTIFNLREICSTGEKAPILSNMQMLPLWGKISSVTAIFWYVVVVLECLGLKKTIVRQLGSKSRCQNWHHIRKC